MTAKSSVEDSNSNVTHHELKFFAEKASEVELRTLLATCLECAGYECNPKDIGLKDTEKGQGDEQQIAPTQNYLDDTVTQRAANKVSSAHIDSFLSNWFVLLRKTLPEESNASQDPQKVIAVASGLACRLLQSPACRRVVSKEYSSSSRSNGGSST